MSGRPNNANSSGSDVEARIAALDWERIAGDLNSHGAATTAPLLNRNEVVTLRAAYSDGGIYRSRIDMARHGFGKGEYKYYAYPLPDIVQSLRDGLYCRLAPIANAWANALGLEVRFPASHRAYIELCHDAGQTKPTPLILKYGPGDYNCLHQDLYGPLTFPFQVAFLLSEPGKEFTGGEFILTEQRPRMQSRAEVVPLICGEGVIFPVHHRPVRGSRGFYRTVMRHGVSRIRSSERYTLGIIFHDAA